MKRLIPFALLALAACSDYDNGFDSKQIAFENSFRDAFGSFDTKQDWNAAKRQSVTVATETARNVKVYAQKDGLHVLVGEYARVQGTQRLDFDVAGAPDFLVVSDGEEALRTTPGGSVDFDQGLAYEDDLTTIETRETRAHDVNRNEWKDKGYIIPKAITPEEEAKVVEAFSKPYYGAYNTVVIPMERMFVQQVHTGTHSYLDGYGSVVENASSLMNHLQVYNKNSDSNVGFLDVCNGGGGDNRGAYEHINDFNAGTHNATFEDIESGTDIKGLTLMHNINSEGVPTQRITDPDGEVVEWVQQFAYHNSRDSRYHAEYIVLEIDGELYLGFDFYAVPQTGQEGNRNMSVKRDWVFDDWIIKLSRAEATEVTHTARRSIEQTAEPQAWILACEDLGGASASDIDYNDVVLKVSHVSGGNGVKVTPLAAGGTLASYVFFESGGGKYVCIGEIHQLLGADAAVSGQYTPVNMGSGSDDATRNKTISTVLENFCLARTTDGNMGGIAIKVLPAGTPAKSRELGFYDPAFGNATTVTSPGKGDAPYIICVPYSYEKANYPGSGEKTKSVWAWPNEGTSIESAYDYFKRWAANADDIYSQDWYEKPNENCVVSTKNLPVTKGDVVVETMTEYEQTVFVDVSTGKSFSVPRLAVREVPESEWVPVVQETPASTMRLTQDYIEIEIGESVDVSQYVADVPDGVQLSYRIDYTDPATLAGTTVTGVKGGETEVIVKHEATDEWKSAECKLTVKVKKLESTLRLTKDYIEIEVGESVDVSQYVAGVPDGVQLYYNCYEKASFNGASLTGNNVGEVTAYVGHYETDKWQWKQVELKVKVKEAAKPEQPEPSQPAGEGGTHVFDFSQLGQGGSVLLEIKDAAAGTYDVVYNGQTLFAGVKELSFEWNGDCRIHSPWGTTSYQGNSGSFRVTLNSQTFSSNGEGHTIEFHDNSGQSICVKVTAK